MTSRRAPETTPLVLQLSRLLTRNGPERYSLPAHHRVHAGRLIDRAANASDGAEAIAAVGGALKLIRTLETKHASPTAALALREAVKASRAALRIVATHWSSGKRAPRRAADGTPLRTGRAPRFGAKAAPNSVPLSNLLEPGRDLRSAHIRTRIMRRKS